MSYFMNYFTLGHCSLDPKGFDPCVQLDSTVRCKIRRPGGFGCFGSREQSPPESKFQKYCISALFCTVHCTLLALQQIKGIAATYKNQIAATAKITVIPWGPVAKATGALRAFPFVVCRRSVD